MTRQEADKADVLVVIPAYRNPEQLQRCLRQVRAQSVGERLQIFVWDNSDRNIYFTAAINEGLLHGLAQPDIRYFLILNQDCYLADNAVQELLACLDENPKAGICAPLQMSADHPDRVVWGGSAQAFPWGAHIVGSAESFTQNTKVVWANGAAMLVRRRVVAEIGLLDTRMRLVASDADYSFTARARGWEILLCPAARCLHDMGVSRPGGGDPDLERIKVADTVYFADKWITGHLYQLLSAEGHSLDLAALRQLRDRIAVEIDAGKGIA